MVGNNMRRTKHLLILSFIHRKEKNVSFHYVDLSNQAFLGLFHRSIYCLLINGYHFHMALKFCIEILFVLKHMATLDCANVYWPAVWQRVLSKSKSHKLTDFHSCEKSFSFQFSMAYFVTYTNGRRNGFLRARMDRNFGFFLLLLGTTQVEQRNEVVEMVFCPPHCLDLKVEMQ